MSLQKKEKTRGLNVGTIDGYACKYFTCVRKDARKARVSEKGRTSSPTLKQSSRILNFKQVRFFDEIMMP